MPNPFCPHGKMWTMCDECKREFIEKQNLSALSKGEFLSERNLAFKCNWMDTDFEGPCTTVGRRFNILEAKHVWCSQPENPCGRLERGESVPSVEFPCYESEIFHKWEFGAGIVQKGERAGQGMRIQNRLVGKVALLTTRAPGVEEGGRDIFGYLRIKDFYSDKESGATHVVGDSASSLKIPGDSRLKFWDFYRNKNTPEKVWSIGLFRYVSDASIRNYLRAQRDRLSENGHGREAEAVGQLLKLYERR